jgi:hypothetical protein
MQALNLASPLAAGLLIAPSLVFAALGLMGDAPGEWGRGTLVVWTALAAALLAGAGLAAGGSAAAWGALALALAATAAGGPPGLVLAAAAVASTLAAGSAPAPRWLAVALAAPPLAVAVREALR